MSKIVVSRKKACGIFFNWDSVMKLHITPKVTKLLLAVSCIWFSEIILKAQKSRYFLFQQPKNDNTKKLTSRSQFSLHFASFYQSDELSALTPN